MLAQYLKRHLKLNKISHNKLHILGVFFLMFLLNSNLKADPVDDFPDENSKKKYESFLIDYDEYNTIYRINFNEYETEKNSKNVPCSFDQHPTYENAEKCVKDLLKGGGWLIVGDSHGRDLYHTLKKIYPKQNIAMFQQS